MQVLDMKTLFLNFKLKYEKPRIHTVRSSEGTMARANFEGIQYFFRHVVVGSSDQVCAQANLLLFSTWLK
ncbi:hypothetical protein CsSME_00017380 [Camellia sinensis var. sinensis]